MRPSLRQLIGRKGLIGAEIGVYQGENALSMLQGLDIAKLYLIDPYEVFDEPSSAMGKTADFPDNELIARELLEGYPVEWIKERSDQAVIPMVDFVYIDGSHEYENVKSDIIRFFPKCRIMIAGHDYFSKSGVKRAVDELLPDATKGKPDWWKMK
jgi:hypothetical protein